MTPVGVQAVLDDAKTIGTNVFNFFPDFKPYEKIFTNSDNSLKTRDEIIEYALSHKQERLIKIFDQVKEASGWKDISDMFMSTQSIYNVKRYDFTHAKVDRDNLVIFDRDNGDLIYVACDQINLIIRFDAEQKGYKINEKTGDVELVDYNKNQQRVNTMYKG